MANQKCHGSHSYNLFFLTYVAKIQLYSSLGFLARDNVKEASDAAEDAKHRVVDEKEAAAAGVQAEGAQLREAAVGCDAWCR